MTVSAIPPIKTYAYTGTGDYDFPFLVYDVADLVVTHISSTGTAVVLDSGDYSSITLAPSDGGTVTVTSAAYGTTGQLQISRVKVIEQTTDWVNNDPFDMELLERTQDEIVMMIQQTDSKVDDALAVIVWRGDWITGTLYNERDMVEGPDGNWYSCLVSHTSGTFATDLASGYWVIVLDVSTIVALTNQAAASADEAEDAATAAMASKNAAAASASSASLSSAQALQSEASAASSAQNAANCNADAYASAVDAAASAASIDPATLVKKDTGTGAAFLPVGTSAQRPGSPTAGYTRFNTDIVALEVWNGTAWVPVGSGASGAVGNPVFYENDIHVEGDYTITTDKNAMSAGPITVNNGVTVTVPNGSVWTVV